jgi:Flp pilus assembly pilin Flp
MKALTAKVRTGWTSLVVKATGLRRDDRGQDLIEYALLAGFIALIAIAAVELLGGGIRDVFGGLLAKVKQIPTT